VIDAVKLAECANRHGSLLNVIDKFNEEQSK
jgi:hypothetical protein